MEDAKNIAKNYNPAEFEDKLYNEWVEKGYFHAEVDKNKKPFTIVIPPPNVTGQLHMGHALDETLQIQENARLQCVMDSGYRPRRYSNTN